MSFVQTRFVCTNSSTGDFPCYYLSSNGFICVYWYWGWLHVVNNSSICMTYSQIGLLTKIRGQTAWLLAANLGQKELLKLILVPLMVISTRQNLADSNGMPYCLPVKAMRGLFLGRGGWEVVIFAFSALELFCSPIFLYKAIFLMCTSKIEGIHVLL